VRWPREVTVLGHRLRVLPMGDQVDGNISGYCAEREECIYIAPGMADGQTDVVLLHEVLHFISDSLGKELTEEQIKGLAEGLYSAGVRIR